MTRPDQYTHTINHYRSILNSGAKGAGEVGWGSDASQQRRFEILSQIAPLSHSSVLDLGCGTGGLYEWFQENGINANYTGVDITPEMVVLANERHPNAAFHTGSIEPLPEALKSQSFDYIFASGIFYMDIANGLDGLFKTVSDMFSVCQRGIAFNSLSSLHSAKDQGEFYADPSVLTEMAGKLTPRYCIRHDYHDGDITLYLYKAQS